MTLIYTAKFSNGHTMTKRSFRLFSSAYIIFDESGSIVASDFSKAFDADVSAKKKAAQLGLNKYECVRLSYVPA